MMTKHASLVKSWVLVSWHDACDEKTTWMTEKEIDEEVVSVQSVGYLIRLTKRYYTLAGCVNVQAASPDTPVFGRVTRIPAGMVTGVTVLREVKK